MSSVSCFYNFKYLLILIIRNYIKGKQLTDLSTTTSLWLVFPDHLTIVISQSKQELVCLCSGNYCIQDQLDSDVSSWEKLLHLFSALLTPTVLHLTMCRDGVKKIVFQVPLRISDLCLFQS